MRHGIEGDAGATLIVGVDGQLGRALRHALHAARRPVMGTTRRLDRVDESTSFLDLGDPRDADLPLAGIATAVICAGVTSIAACADDPFATAAINVEGTAHLAERLVGAGVHTVFLSSNAVFDGSQPFPHVGDETVPASEYGRQKRMAEERLLSIDGPICIMRFSKILSPDAALFRRWSAALGGGRTIEPTGDAFFAPLSMAFAAEALVRAIATRTRGVIQASANRDISYADAAVHLADRLGLDPLLVRPKTAASLGQPPFPRHTAMNPTTLRSLGLEPPDPFDALDSLELSATESIPPAAAIALAAR